MTIQQAPRTESGPGRTAGTRPDLNRIIAEQEEIFVRRQPGSRELASRASRALAGGVASSWQITAPAAGLAEPRPRLQGLRRRRQRVRRPARRLRRRRWPGTPTRRSWRRSAPGRAAAPTSPSPPRTRSLVAEELARRFGLPLWRFANSGTEATMDAVHLMRAITGRDLIIKVEGCYHGHHDSVQVSVLPEPDEVGPARRARPRSPSSTGIPQAITRPRPWSPAFNDLGSVAAAAGRAPGPGRRDDPRADHDERRDHPARARLPRRAARPAARPRRAAHLRRGQDRPHRRAGRRHRADRGHARHRLPGQGHRRRHRGRRDRRHATR